jgi:tripartite-type tricarboxylate transporter receptor subunit TctC
VENRAGAGGTLGADTVAKAAGDGYTLLLGEPGSITINPSLMKLPYDPARDLAAVAQVVSVPMVLVASPSFQVKSLKDLVAQHAGKQVHYGTPGAGTIQHLTMAEFARASGVQFTHVPYRGGAPLVTDLVGGHVSLGMLTVPTIVPMVQAGTVVPLGVLGRARAPLLPQVPTLAESGYPAFTKEIWQGFFVPASTPRPLVDTIARALHKAVQTPEVEKTMGDMGASVTTSQPAEFQAMVREEIGYWARIIKEVGLQPQ